MNPKYIVIELQNNAVHEWLTRYGYESTVFGDLPIVLQRDSLQ